jgi:hypothetical protein
LKFDSSFFNWAAERNTPYMDDLKFVPANLHPETMLKQFECEFIPSTWDPSVVDEGVENFIYEYFKPYMVGARFLDVNEAIHGCAELNVEPMDLTTSVGYGLSKFFKSKRDLMRQKPELAITLATEDWRALEERTSMPIWFLKASLKDELRTVEKVSEGKTRVFIAGPYVYTVTERRLYGALHGLFVRAAVEHNFPSAVGEDYYGGGWMRMLKYVSRDFAEDTVFGDGDVKSWDKKFQRYWRLANIYLMARWYGSTEALKSLVWHEIRYNHTWIVAGVLGHILFSNTGYGSGRGDTAFNNSLANFRVHVTIFRQALTRHKIDECFTIDHFDAWYRTKVLGDDNAYGVVAKLGVDQDLVISYYAKFGWECLRNHPDETTLENLEFAGRRSMYIPEFQTFWPVIPLERIVHINFWGRDLESPEIREQRADAAANLIFPYLWSTERDRSMMAMLVLYYYFLLKDRPNRSRHHLTDYAKLYLGPDYDEFHIKDVIRRKVESLDLDVVDQKQLLKYI